jgi:hypothetical protein
MSKLEEVAALVKKHQPVTSVELDKHRPKHWKVDSASLLSLVWHHELISRLPMKTNGRYGPRWMYAAPDYPGGIMHSGHNLPATVSKPKPSKIPDKVQPYPSDNTVVIRVGNKEITIKDV